MQLSLDCLFTLLEGLSQLGDMGLLLLVEGLGSHHSSIATSQYVKLAVAEGHIEDHFISILTAVARCSQLI